MFGITPNTDLTIHYPKKLDSPEIFPHIKRIVIANPERTYGDMLQSICKRSFPQAEILRSHRGKDLVSDPKFTKVDLLILSLNFDDSDGAELLLKVSQSQSIRNTLILVGQRFATVLSALRKARVNAIIDTYTEPLATVQYALRIINQGHLYISASLKPCLMEHGDSSEIETLSSAEIRVLQVIGTGCDNQEGSKVLGLQESTVQTHRRNIMRKLEISTSAKLVLEAARLGFVHITSSGITSPMLPFQMAHK